MKQEIMLHHMGIINIDGYYHARVHAGITPTVPHSSIFFSSFVWLHHVVLVDIGSSLAILLPYAMLLSL